jgi:hypothetical protein
MRKLRDAEIAEVRKATPDDPATRSVTENHQPFEIWLLEVAGDLGRVRMQLPTGECGTIAELHCRFAAWVNAPERTPAERDRYFNRCREIENGTYNRWLRPIVLGPERQIHDGKHRLLAAYARALAGGPLNLEVFWGCTEACHSHRP